MQNYSPYSDHELIILLREGSESAFTEIYKRYSQNGHWIKCIRKYTRLYRSISQTKVLNDL